MGTRTGNFAIGFRRASNIDWQKDLAVQAQWAKEAGFDLIDFDRITSQDAAVLKQWGLALGAVDLIDFPNIMHNDPGKRRELIERNVAFVKEAAGWGAKAMFTCILPGDATRKRAENYKLAIDCYAPIAEACAAAGASLAVEGYPGGPPHYPALVCNPETTRAFLKDIGKGAGLNYDPSHLIRLEIDHIRFLKEFAPHVKHVHGKDTDVNEEARYEFGTQGAAFQEPHRWGQWIWRYTIPGHGVARWGDIFRILKDAGFRGAVSVELEDENFNGTEEGEKHALLHSLDYLRSV
ncbi:MAG TPA: sugar phosphate isomerase/epimerase [Tepidisphaeraceae bacterium]|jgi:sugar phosphate isomerase/epimerase